MKRRLFFGLFVTLLLAVTHINFAHADVNDFTITDFQADYYLDKDNEGRSTLKTVEKITAEFPNFDQNHGIERALPKSYDGHSVNLKVQSVENQDGNSLNYSTHDDNNDNLVLRIGDKDTFVHGIYTYVITYTEQDITKFFSDTNDDEFYWDTNGTYWSHPFDSVTARLHISPSIEKSLTGSQSCYYGVYGSNKQCDIKKDGNVFVASATELGVGENMTIAVGFNPHTFIQYKMSVIESIIATFLKIYPFAALISFILTVALLIALFVLKLTKGKGAPGRGTIIPEYLPPKGINVALSSLISGNERTWTAAMYIDLAVRHKIKIIERKEGIFKRTAYTLEFVSNDSLDETEAAVMTALFGENPKIGKKHVFELKEPSYTFSSKLFQIYKKVKRFAKKNGYYEADDKLRKEMITLVVIIGVLCIFTMLIGLFAIGFGVWVLTSTKPLSQKGRELLDYLSGLKLYIKIAEEDRIKVLQSPQGAEKTPINTDDKAEMLHLYERVLPYAVLFGNEKEWTKVLGEFYDQQGTQPDWYTGNSTFNAVVFASALSSFSSSTTSNSYMSSSSSSSGGSGGGGFSGGGGGGGGGGGW